MYTNDYIRSMVSSNEAIYIDTASLMDVENLELFIENAEWVLLNEHRKIIVPRAVCLELTRHLGSQNPVKKDKAVRVLEMLGSHGDIFEVCDEDIREEALKAFADSELLAELTLNRTACGQLLITNDRRLSEDAYKLNDQVSCRGHKVMVCFINRFGELCKCECVRAQFAADCGEETHISEATVSAQKSSTNIMEEQSLCQTVPRFKISQILIPVGTFAAGFITSKYGKPAVKYIKSLF